jgi:26S proteasome regulatory subunit N12
MCLLSVCKLIPFEQHQNVYISYPMKLEQYLMEGRYNRMWSLKDSAPAQEFHFFVDTFVDTVR